MSALAPRPLGILMVALCLCVSGPVTAQELASSADSARARSLFEQGKGAMSVGRFARAAELFQASLDLVPRASPAFNLAVALRGVGKPKEASDLLRALLENRYGALPAQRRSQVVQLLRETAREVAKLRVVATGAESAEVRVDGHKVAQVREGEPAVVEVNPGERLVTLSAKLRDTAERRVVVAAGRSHELSVKLELSREARRATLVVVAEEPNDIVEIVGVNRGRGRVRERLDPGRYTLRITSARGSRESNVMLKPAREHQVLLDSPRPALVSSPWFWTAAGVVVAGAAVGGYFLIRPGTAEPVRDPEFGVVQTLTLGP